jgi:transmembrane sensor
MNWRAATSDISEDLAIDAEAAAWIGVREAGASAQQEAEFAAWLKADARHGEAYNELAAASRRLEPLRVLRPVDGSPPERDFPMQPRARGVRAARRRIAAILVPVAAAAALALAFLSPWDSRPVEFSDAAATEIGGWRKLTLPDGSVIELNTDTTLKVSFSSVERSVVLTRGEAHFAVAEDAIRPFIVKVGAVSVRAVGTAFNVRLLDAAVEVLVTEGKVGVENAVGSKSFSAARSLPPAEIITAGQKGLVSASVADDLQPVKVVVSPVTSAEISQRLAWQERRLDFGPTALQDILVEFNRYSQHRLIIVDPEVASLIVGCSFRAGDVEALVRLLESNFDIQAELRGKETILRKRREGEQHAVPGRTGY